MNQEKIGNFIAENRKIQNLTQEQLAEKLNVSKNAVSKWERGLNLPDASIMQELCIIIGISLNELFAGEKLKDKEIVKQSEKNLIDIISLSNNSHKKYKAIITIILVILATILVRFILVKCGYIMDNNLKYTQVYISGESNIKGDIDINSLSKININYDVGANKYGYAVFKNPNKALKTLKNNNAKGLKLIQKEYKLLPLNRFNFREYKTYGWQVTTGTKEEQEEARFISIFMDIYENSFN